ncbi:MAG: tetratricopeptide repeat protein, partial [Myxococcales bacterium]|nr:tetratricopeptide repeat protein [Myxococcales bacterium]
MTSNLLTPAPPGNAAAAGMAPVGGQTVLRGPVWSLRVEGRRVAIVLQGAPLPGGAELTELVIFLPHVSFPFDFREGIERFRHHRGDAELLEIAVDARALLDWLHRVSGGRIGGTAHDDTLVLSGRTRHGARYTVRARVIADGQPSGDDDEPTLVLSLFQVRVYGNVTEPWPVLAGRVIDLLPKELIVDRTLTTARIRLVRPALAWALSALGWKLPDLSRLRARGVELRAGQLVARFVSEAADYGRLLSLEAMEDQGLRGAFERFVEDLELKRHHGQVDRLLGQRQIREALAEVYRALDGPPQPGFLAERLIGIAASQPILFDEGERVCKDLLRVSPEYEPALCGLASIALGRGRREEAAMQLERLAGILTGPGDREDATAADLSVAEILRETAHKEARQALQRVLERSPDHEEALEALITLSEAEGDVRATLPLYKRLLFAARSQQRTRDAGLRLARHALERGQAEDARVFLRVVLDASPTDLEAQLALAEVEEKNDDPAEAVRILEGALRSVPATDTGHVVRVIERLGRLALDRLGDSGKTKRVLWRAIDLDPVAPADALALAQLALDAGEPVLVERHLEAVPPASKHAAEADVLRAKALLARGKTERALEITFGVLEAEPHNGEALDLIERCTPDLGERELLVNKLAQSARRVPSGAGRARILARVGRIYESLGLGWDAISPYESSLDEANDGPDANEAAERLLALYAEFGMWPKHQDLCRVRLPKKRDPAERVALLLRIGRVALRELADPEQARPFLEEAVTLAPRHLEALSLYREALERLQQGIALIRVLSRIESLHPDDHARNEARIRLAELQLDGLDAPGQARATLARLPPETNADPRVIALKQRLGLLPKPSAADAAARSPEVSYATAVRLADEGRDVEALAALEKLLADAADHVPARELEGLLRARL